MSVRTRPMFAIPFAINLGSVAVILRQCGFASCNQRAHGPPMFAIPTPDVCRSLQVMGAGAGFHPNEAGRLLGKEVPDLGAAKLSPDKHLSISGNCVNLEDVLGEVETDRRWLHGMAPCSRLTVASFAVSPVGSAGAVHPVSFVQIVW